MEDNSIEEKIMTFMAMTECKDRNVAAQVLERNNWDEISAANTYFAQQHEQPAYIPEPAPMRNERLVDDYAYHDRQFYGQDPNPFPRIEMPSIFGGISSFFGSVKDSIFGWAGGKYFLKELSDKYPEIDYSNIHFE